MKHDRLISISHSNVFPGFACKLQIFLRFTNPVTGGQYCSYPCKRSCKAPFWALFEIQWDLNNLQYTSQFVYKSICSIFKRIWRGWGVDARREGWGARGAESSREARGRDTRRARERESTRTLECDVAECATYIEALEGARKSKKAEWQVVTRHYRLQIYS